MKTKPNSTESALERPDDQERTTAVIETTKGRKRRWMQAHKAARMNWNQFAAEALDKASGQSP